MLDAADLGRYIDDRLTRSAFRLELLDSYEVEADGDDFARYLRGEPNPNSERKQPWLDRLRREREAGILNQRVHVLSTPLTDYLRYECEWGYEPNAAAGEDIRIVDLTEHAAPEGLVDHDFWLIDDRYAIRMHYDDSGRFLGAEPVGEGQLSSYVRAREAAITVSELFTAWWARRPEQHRFHQVG